MEPFIQDLDAEIGSPFFDPDGFLHVLSEETGEIFSIDSAKAIHPVCNSGGQPKGAAYGPDGNLYIADPAHQAVMVWLEGKAQILVKMYEEKNFKGPHSITFGSTGVLYFTDPGPFGETSLTNPKGSLFAIINGGQRNNQILKPIALGCLAYPTGLALSPDEKYIFVAEMMTNRLLRFCQKPTGVYHASVFYQFAGGIGPSGVAVGEDGTIYVSHFDFANSDEGNVAPQLGRLSVLSPTGLLLSEISIPGGSQITGLTLSPDKSELYLSETFSRCIYKLQV